MANSETATPFDATSPAAFGFRPWVRRAGLSILLTAGLAAACLGANLLVAPEARFGWAGEPFVWIYVGTLALAGARVYVGTFAPAATISASGVVLRPLHQLRPRRIAWGLLTGTEQTLPGDRLIVYYATPRGSRMVAMNLNLIKGRTAFETALAAALSRRGFGETLKEGAKIRQPATTPNA